MRVAFVTMTVVLASTAIADARPVIDMALQDTIGCIAKTDLLDIRQAGKTQEKEDITITAARAKIVIEAKVKTGKCFQVAAGQQAIIAPEWQNATDVWSGISIMQGASGRRFYTNSWSWKYIGELPNFVKP